MEKKPLRRRDYSPLIEQLLEPYGVWQEKDDKYRSACPFHLGDNKTTFAIYRSGRFQCYKCDASGWMDHLYAKIHRIRLADAKKIIESDSLPLLYDMSAAIAKMGAKAEPAKRLREADIVPFLGLYPRYLLGRGFSKASLKLYDIGYDLEHSKIVLPVRDVNRGIVGITYRIDYEDDVSQPAKYWHDNFDKSHHLYGFHLVKTEPVVYLVEGQLDTVRMQQLGMPAAGIMGSALSQTQADLIVSSAANEVVLAFDNDEAGEKATGIAIKLLRGRVGKLKTLSYPGKDPGELRTKKGLLTRPWHDGLFAEGVLPFADRYAIREAALKAALWKGKKR